MRLTRRSLWRMLSGVVIATSSATRARARQIAATGAVPRLAERWPQVSGIYPHLAFFNDGGPGQDYECGIGAIVPWAGRLWAITYPPHRRSGSADRLYEIDDDLDVTVRAESVGGTHAGRMLHRDSRQLVIGPYFIDEQRRVRALEFRDGFAARITAYARHLTDPARAVYLVDMEGPIWEIDVRTLAKRRIFVKPAPGWHGKGAATAYGRLVIANNGEQRSRDLDGLPWEAPESSWSRGEEDAGVLAEWDGTSWQIVSRRPHTEVTGPAGLTGEQPPGAPLWSMGWDRRSVLLHVRLQDGWQRYRVPKGSYTYDPSHGWFTEWPRIREIGDGPLLMNMHGTFFALPRDFGAATARGLAPIATHLHYTTDFCAWQGRVVLAGDDTSILQNALAARPQSNLRFLAREALATSLGPRTGWGGPWVRDRVSPGQASDPLLVAGYDEAWLHLAHDTATATAFLVEGADDARGPWRALGRVDVAAGRSGGAAVPTGSHGWVRVTSDRAATVSAYAHLRARRPSPPAGTPGDARFDCLSRTTDAAPWIGGIVRPAPHSRDLTCLATRRAGAAAAGAPVYVEVDARLAFARPSAADRAADLARVAHIAVDHEVDDASVLITDGEGRRWRLPKRAGALGPGDARGLREVISERYLANYAGTFHEIPRQGTTHAPDFRRMKPVASHDCRITDFATWRGLLVLAGIRADAAADAHCARTAEGDAALWFGAIDDLYALGAPAGDGGPWHRTRVQAGVASDPYLMTGFDARVVRLQHDAPDAISVRVEHDALADGTWWLLDEIAVPPGEPFAYELPAGFMTHWLRLVPSRDAVFTATVHAP